MDHQDIVIDKSFLYGAPKERLEFLFSGHRVLMPEALFYELLTTEPYKRANCFNRLPSVENPVVLVHNVGPILRWEVTNQQPLPKIDEVTINLRYQFNANLISKDFELGGEQMYALNTWRMEMHKFIQNFVNYCRNLTICFPNLRGYQVGADSSEIEETKQQLCTDQELVRQIYASSSGEGWPVKDIVNEKWALYRWVQIRLLAALDYFRKYGEMAMNSDSKKIENEYMDLEYCLVGCIVGGIATRDSGMAERFLCLCPSGILIR